MADSEFNVVPLGGNIAPPSVEAVSAVDEMAQVAACIDKALEGVQEALSFLPDGSTDRNRHVRIAGCRSTLNVIQNLLRDLHKQ